MFETSVATPDVASRESAQGTVGSFATITTWLTLLFAAISILLFPFSPAALIFLAAIFAGWCEANGACGASHICAITPFYEYDRNTWKRAALAYALSGIATALGVGALLGYVGLFLPLDRGIFYLSISALASILICRELKLLRFPLPQVHFQTDRNWAYNFGFVTAAGMWGAHIGLALATVIKHGSIYILGALAIEGGPIFGAILIATYWVGRALPIVLAPLCFSRPFCSDDAASDLLLVRHGRYRQAAAVTLGCLGIVCLSLALEHLAILDNAVSAVAGPP